MTALELCRDWPVDHVAAAVLVDGEPTDAIGDLDRPFALASITKLITAMAALVAHEEGTLDLDEVITPAGATTADLLAHAGGLAPDTLDQLSAPHRRRIYSTSAYEHVAATIARRAAMDADVYIAAAVVDPLAMANTRITGSAGAGAWSTVGDLAALTNAWRRPVLVDETTRRRATSAHRPELAGVLPGFGRHDPNPWGLGPEIRGRKTPHWTGSRNSEATFGHFGQAGTLLWIDPAIDVAAIVLTDRPFGDWAVERWAPFADAVVEETGRTRPA